MSQAGYDELCAEWNKMCRFVATFPNVPIGLASLFSSSVILTQSSQNKPLRNELLKAMKINEKHETVTSIGSSVDYNTTTSSTQSKGRAIPLVLPNNMTYNHAKQSYESNGQDRKSLVPNQEALKILEQIRGDIAVVSVVGPYRSGKSYLMSKVVGQTDSFQLGHSMNAMTHGIWMYSEPLKWKLENGNIVNVILLDSEGIGASTTNGTSDHQIFALSLLLSSMFIYNSKQVFNAEDINQLDFIANITKHIQVKAGSSMNAEDESLQKYFPAFFWVLRDVLLEPMINNKKVSIKEYFEKEVASPKSKSKEGMAKFLIKDTIKNLFGEFDVFDIPPPTTDKELLKNVGRFETQLGKPFLNSMNHLIDRVKMSIQPKIGFNGVKVTGSQYVSMIKYYVETVNSGSVPSIQGAWEVASEMCFNNATKLGKEKYVEEMNKVRCKFPLTDYDLKTQHEHSLKAAFSRFNSIANFETDTEKYKTILQQMQNEIFCIEDQKITGLYKKFYDENYTISKKMCEELISQYQKEIGNLVKNIVNDPNVGVILGKLNGYVTEYDKKAKGSAKEDVGKILRAFVLSEHDKINILSENINAIKKSLIEKEQNVLRIQNEKREYEEKSRQLKLQADMERNMLQQQLKFIEIQSQTADKNFERMIQEERNRKSNFENETLRLQQEIKNIQSNNKLELERMQQQLEELKNKSVSSELNHHPHHHHRHHGPPGGHPHHHHHHRH